MTVENDSATLVCFKDVLLAFDGGATSRASLQCTSDPVIYSFPAVTTASVRINFLTIHSSDWLNPGAREIEFYEFAGVHEAPLPLVLPPHGFAVGASLACFGTWDADDTDGRFSVNFRDADDDYVLHINPRSYGVIVRNTLQGGTWGPEEGNLGGEGFPFQFGRPFVFQVD